MNDATQFFNTTAGGGYEIERSLRFNSADSAYLSRTPSVAGNRTTWSFSAWVKRSKLGTQQTIFIAGETYGAGSGDNYATGLAFGADNKLKSYWRSSFAPLASSLGVYRDVSAWYHVACVANGSTLKCYVNSIEVSSGAISGNGAVNSTLVHLIGVAGTSTYFAYGDLYLADIHFIDGQALTPSSFGEFDTNGIWQPIAYSGGYGTNGFHLEFLTGSGTDTSGNNNFWTAFNFGSSGSGNDSLVDTPTNYGTDTGAGGEVRGNYATLNPLIKGSLTTVANGNLEMTISGWNSMFGTIAYPSTGKWYYEITLSGVSSGEAMVGIFSTAGALFTAAGTYFGNVAGSYAWYNGALKFSGGASSAYGATWGFGDVIGVAFDVDTGTLTFYKNGVSQGSAYTGITGQYFPAVSRGNQAGQILICNFGQRPFAYTAPSGFKALCTQNLPTPTIADGSTAMDVVLDTGANILTAAQGAIGGSADLLWIKDRANANNHQLIDTVRGGTATLQSNTTATETTYSAPSGSSVAWTWDAGSSTVTNTDGTITSQVRANPSAGFSIVSYTGNSTAGATVGHGLGVAPVFVIVKNRDQGPLYYWNVYHASLGATKYLRLESTDGAATSAAWWNNTAPTSSIITLGNADVTNRSTDRFISYCFAPVAGYSAFGSYTGNGSADGPFVYTGFRPRWILYKNTAAGNNWILVDTARDPGNVCAQYLYANASNSEGVFGVFDFLSNGFKARTGDSQTNLAGNTYIYAAFAENPFKYSRAR